MTKALRLLDGETEELPEAEWSVEKVGVAVAEAVAIGVDDAEEQATSVNVAVGVRDGGGLEENVRSGEEEAEASADDESDGAVDLDMRELGEMNAVNDSIGDADALE